MAAAWLRWSTLERWSGIFSKRRILLVDDDLPTLMLFVRLLTDAKYSVAAASSGSEALRMLHENSVDLVVLDLNMPRPDGFEILKILRSRYRGMKILVVSGSVDGPLLKASELVGASASLRKVDAPTQLVKTVDTLIG